MGFFTIIFGYYGGVETPPVVATFPNDGWIPESRDRVFISLSRERVWIAKGK
jgi:hypothetical protein